MIDSPMKVCSGDTRKHDVSVKVIVVDAQRPDGNVGLGIGVLCEVDGHVPTQVSCDEAVMLKYVTVVTGQVNVDTLSGEPCGIVIVVAGTI